MGPHVQPSQALDQQIGRCPVYRGTDLLPSTAMEVSQQNEKFLFQQSRKFLFERRDEDDRSICSPAFNRPWTLLDISMLVLLSSAIMDKPSFDPGFTEKYRGDLHRIINPNGQFNVRRRGTTWRDVHPYLFMIDRKSTRLNSSHLVISYAVFCLKK